jgi:hypothetical protein
MFRRILIFLVLIVFITTSLTGCMGNKTSKLSFDFPTNENTIKAFTNSETFGMAMTA